MTERYGNSFSRQMRAETRDVHKLSDALVNAKLAFAMSDDAVWADGLLIFYEIFKYLEEHAPPDILPIEYHRTLALEADLAHYLGYNWKDTYTPRKEVQNYVQHLESINKENPILLMAYVYHLYMGLLSGGQILQKKRSLAKRLSVLYTRDTGDNIGTQVTYFENYTISELKTKMRNIVDETAETLSDDIREALLNESKTVFELNNKIVRTVRGVGLVGIKKIVLCVIIIISIFLSYKVAVNLFGN